MHINSIPRDWPEKKLEMLSMYDYFVIIPQLDLPVDIFVVDHYFPAAVPREEKTVGPALDIGDRVRNKPTV